MKSKALKNVLANLFSKIFIQGLNFLSSLMLARISGARVLGNVSLATAFQNMFNNTVSICLGNAHLKIHNENPDTGIRTFAVVSLISRLVIGFVIIILGLFLLYSGSKLYTQLQIYLIILFVVQTIIGAVAQTSNYVFAAKLEAYKSNIANIIQSVLVAIARIAAVYLGYLEFGITGFIIVATILSVIFPIFQLQKEQWGKFDKKLSVKYLKVAANMVSGTICYGLLTGFDRVYLGALVHDAKQLGYYSAGSNLGLMFLNLGTSMGGVFLSVFSKNKYNNNNEDNVAIINKYEKTLTLFIFPIFIGSMIFSNLMIHVFYGQAYIAASIVLLFSVLHSFIKTQSIPLINIYFSFNMFKQYNINNLIYAISIIVFVSVIGYINPFNNFINSVGFAIMLTSLVERGLYVYHLRKQGYSIAYVSAPAAIIAYFAIFFIIYFGVQHYTKSAPIIVGATLLLYAVTFLSLKFAKVYKAEDFAFIKQIVKR
jgi:O-antigen/teichoic acid export membrane protein